MIVWYFFRISKILNQNKSITQHIHIINILHVEYTVKVRIKQN